MAAKPFEQDDPLELIEVKVRLPAAPNGEAQGGGPFANEEDCLEEMARTFVDEYARIGWNREQLFTLFRDPFYQGPHAIYQARGEAFVQQLIAERLPAPTAVGAQAGVPEHRPPAPVDGDCPRSLVCDACPVGRSFGQVNCPIKRTARGVIAGIRTWLFRRSSDA